MGALCKSGWPLLIFDLGFIFQWKKSTDSIHKLWTMPQGRSMVVHTVARLCSSLETELVASYGLKASLQVRGNREEVSGMLTGCRRGLWRGGDGWAMRLCDSGQSRMAGVVHGARTRGNQGGKWCSVRR
jgi:hypothetical protein